MHYQNMIFAGGGSRCFWQVGFWDGAVAAGLELDKTVQYGASTSAGCAMITASMLGRGTQALDMFKRLSDANPGNIHWHNLWPGNSGPLLPHIRMYREALEEFLSEADLQALSGRRIEFLMAKSPRYMQGGFATTMAFSVYGLEKHLTGKIHPSWTQKLGFTPLVYGNQDALGVEDFISMILSASCVPPVLPGDGFRGQAVLDGGMIDNVPAHLSDARPGNTLVLLSKRYRKPLPEVPRRTYLQPSKPIKLDKFDYANPAGLQDTYDLGYGDGMAFARQNTGQ
jgi:Patatin-like phospholipase